jgi:hypothetical protein
MTATIWTAGPRFAMAAMPAEAFAVAPESGSAAARAAQRVVVTTEGRARAMPTGLLPAGLLAAAVWHFAVALAFHLGEAAHVVMMSQVSVLILCVIAVLRCH